MPDGRSHKTTANRIAKKYNTEYNNGPGPDVRSGRATVEVETEHTVGEGMRQLQGYRGPAYIAGTNRAAVDKALELTKSKTVGVMDNHGNIVKPSTRKR